MKLKPHSIRKISKTSKILIAVATIFIIASFVAPAISVSTSPCSLFHGTKYYQQLDLQEGSGQIPTTLQVGQVATVSVALQNVNNAPRNNLLSSVSVTLRSQNNHFSVGSPTFNIGNLATGSATATWQITGTSAGQDQIIISASAVNNHEPGLTFADSFLSNPSITVSASATTPSPNPTTPPTSTPPSTATPTSTSNPTQNPTAPPGTSPTPNVTGSPTPSATEPTMSPAATPYSSNDPTASPSPGATPDPTNPSSQPSTPEVTTNPTTPENPTPTQNPAENRINQALNSNMLYIHPPLAIVGYLLIFIFSATFLKMGINSNNRTKVLGLITWTLIALGLLTGMIWAQIVSGSYWSWDPKETFTLALFVAFSAGQVAYFENKQGATKVLLIMSCILVFLTASTSLLF